MGSNRGNPRGMRMGWGAQVEKLGRYGEGIFINAQKERAEIRRPKGKKKVKNRLPAKRSLVKVSKASIRQRPAK